MLEYYGTWSILDHDVWLFIQWEFQDPKMEVPTIYKAYGRGYTPKIWSYMVQYLHFRILEFPLIYPWTMVIVCGYIKWPEGNSGKKTQDVNWYHLVI